MLVLPVFLPMISTSRKCNIYCRGGFIREYVGEVLGSKEFRHRVKQYARDQHRHYYFMALNADEIIDATQKGNISRFINHSCDPNSETQKVIVCHSMIFVSKFNFELCAL